MVERKRHLAKAVTYRVCGSVATVAVAYFITKDTAISATIGTGDALAKIALYYIHERLWYRI